MAKRKTKKTQEQKLRETPISKKAQKDLLDNEKIELRKLKNQLRKLHNQGKIKFSGGVL